MIDTHCHILKEYYENQSDVINNMEDNIIVVSSASPREIDEVIKLTRKYKNVYGTIGIHPEYANKYTLEDIKKIEKHINDKKIVGIGEIGLDYHYTSENKENQKKLFIKQIEIANKYKKAIVIHSRDSKIDTYNILKKYRNKETPCNMHCYSYDLTMAKKLIKDNITLGIGGIVTFKNETKLKKVVSNIPLKYLVLETDSPYLTPEPKRGKTNEPKNIIFIAQKISELKNIKYEEVLKQTTKNAKKLYNIWIKNLKYEHNINGTKYTKGLENKGQNTN